MTIKLGLFTMPFHVGGHDWDRPALWRQSMELLATEVMPKFSRHASSPRA